MPKLPEGVTWQDLLKRHCPKNFFKNYRRGDPVIYPAHRGFILFPDRPDNSMSSYIAAGEFGVGIVELDVAMLRRMLPDDEAPFILGHDRTAERKTAYSTSEWSDLTPTEAVGLPHIVREVKNTHFTDCYYVTNQQVGSISSF
ncbi:glycerophosphoryl diester phosphodiesterase [Rhizobium aethiopicum]|uniref:hypothetical protein n=1 Tax=Rhizobium aethiopicum TaxID=1138170 RepID=UPI00161DC282|nr:hypothetical protein [Rhizobium aethiopicum]MBB4581594.1 glycerophosphoryl diester phosphodiesterase [Rhizobium aethiopicum]